MKLWIPDHIDQKDIFGPDAWAAHKCYLAKSRESEEWRRHEFLLKEIDVSKKDIPRIDQTFYEMCCFVNGGTEFACRSVGAGRYGAPYAVETPVTSRLQKAE